MLQKAACLVAAVALHAGAGAVCFVVAWKEPPRPAAQAKTVEIALSLGAAPAVRRVDSEPPAADPSARKEASRSEGIARTSSEAAGVEHRPPAEPPVERSEAGATENRAAAVAVDTPEPPYPPLARRRGWSGRGVIEFKIAVDGACRDIRVVESTGHKILDDAMIEAVSRWRFRPERVGDESIVAIVRKPFRFHLGEH